MQVLSTYPVLNYGTQFTTVFSPADKQVVNSVILPGDTKGLKLHDHYNKLLAAQTGLSLATMLLLFVAFLLLLVLMFAVFSFVRGGSVASSKTGYDAIPDVGNNVDSTIDIS